jgi:RNA polymerase sigma factor (sigma-70 family)
VGQAGITESDVEDIEQDLRGALLAALPGFDPGKSKLSTFATRVIERRSVDILRHRMVELRAFNGPMRSLEDEIETDDGPQLLLEAVTRADNDRRFNCVPVDTDDARCLAMDLNDLVPLLPPDLRKLHEDLKTKSVTQIAAEQNVHRRSIDRRKARLRRWLERRSLQDYLKSTRALLARETNERNGDT